MIDRVELEKHPDSIADAINESKGPPVGGYYCEDCWGHRSDESTC